MSTLASNLVALRDIQPSANLTHNAARVYTLRVLAAALIGKGC